MKQKYYVPDFPEVDPIPPAKALRLNNVVELSTPQWRMRAISDYIRRAYANNRDFDHDRRLDENGHPHLVFRNFTVSYRSIYPECALEIHNRKFSTKIKIPREGGRRFNIGNIGDRLIQTIRRYPQKFGLRTQICDVPEVHDQRY